jgi:hypothetical protein
MNSALATKSFAAGNASWRRFVKPLFIILLSILFFLLALSMVHHRFHRGGRMNERGTLLP